MNSVPSGSGDMSAGSIETTPAPAPAAAPVAGPVAGPVPAPAPAVAPAHAPAPSGPIPAPVSAPMTPPAVAAKRRKRRRRQLADWTQSMRERGVYLVLKHNMTPEAAALYLGHGGRGGELGKLVEAKRDSFPAASDRKVEGLLALIEKNGNDLIPEREPAVESSDANPQAVAAESSLYGPALLIFVGLMAVAGALLLNVLR